MCLLHSLLFAAESKGVDSQGYGPESMDYPKGTDFSIKHRERTQTQDVNTCRKSTFGRGLRGKQILFATLIINMLLKMHIKCENKEKLDICKF